MTRPERGSSLSARQLFLRRLLRRVEARVETLPPFFMTMVSAALIGGSALYASILSGQASVLASKVTTAIGFEVHTVAISGQHYMRERDILDILGLSPGVSLMTFDVAQAHETLLREPWVQSASIRKVYPGKLQIDLKEREPFAIWQRGKIVSVVDKDGLVLDDYDSGLYSGLPIVVGHGAQRQAETFIELVNAFPTLRARMRAAMLHSERRWDLLLDNGMTIKLPEENVKASLGRLVTLDEQKAILSKDLVSVDMRLPDRLVMQLSDEAMVNRRAALDRRKELRSKEKHI